MPKGTTGEITVRVQDRIFTRLRRNEMYERVMKDVGCKYWSTRIGWEEGTENQVGWEELEIAGMGAGEATWITNIKIASGHIPVAHKLKQRGYRNNNMCPYCGEKETVDHMFQCSSALLKENWEESILNIKKVLVKLSSKIQIINEITENLERWREGKEEEEGEIGGSVRRLHQEERKVATCQQSIG